MLAAKTAHAGSLSIARARSDATRSRAGARPKLGGERNECWEQVKVHRLLRLQGASMKGGGGFRVGVKVRVGIFAANSFGFQGSNPVGELGLGLDK